MKNTVCFVDAVVETVVIYEQSVETVVDTVWTLLGTTLYPVDTVELERYSRLFHTPLLNSTVSTGYKVVRNSVHTVSTTVSTDCS